jgi:signal transduction histidine kinase
LNTGALQRAIFNSANFSSIATDAEGVIQIFNVGAERMLGYEAADVMNRLTPADISDSEELVSRAAALSVEYETPITPGFQALVFRASRGIEDIYELTYIRKDASRFPAVVSVTALRDGKDAIIGYLLIGTDNTARKKAEQALIDAGALQNAIFNSATFSSIATDARGVIQIFNVGAERMLGYTAEEVLNRITPADISDPQELVARATALTAELGTPITAGFEALVFKASRGIEDIYELTYIRKNGSRFPAVVSVTALRDAQDAIIGYLLIGTDNTARKHTDEEQRKLEQLLRDQQVAVTVAVAFENARKLQNAARENIDCERRVALRTAGLQRSNLELEQFAYVASHDLQEPLRTVTSFTELLSQRYMGKLDSDADEFMGFIVEAAQRMKALITDLLTYSRLNAQDSPSTQVDIARAVARALANLAASIEEQHAVVTVDPMPTILADEPQLVQLFQNLIGNALKFRGEAVPAIHISAEFLNMEWVFRVKDNGIGIEPQHAERIFVMFQRLHTRAAYAGTGIGLALCKRIVTRLGGRIWMVSTPGTGTTFFFTVPVAPPEGL